MHQKNRWEHVSTAVASFTQYRERIRGLLAVVTPHGGLAFCLWCGSRFPQEFGEGVWNGLTEAERLRLEAIVTRLREAAAKQQLVDPETATQLQAELEAFGPHDEVAAIEVHPDGVEFRSLVWQTLEYCRTREVSALCAVSESLVNAWDYRIEQSATSYDLENMFTFPELKLELALQEEYLARSPRIE